jgi:hypothetical protein
MPRVTRSERYRLFQEVATPLWQNLKDPLAYARDEYKPLDQTIFSVESLVYTKFYIDFPETFSAGIHPSNLALERCSLLADSIRVLFYGTEYWYKSNRKEIQKWVSYCSDFTEGDFIVTVKKSADYIKWRVEAKRDQLATGPVNVSKILSSVLSATDHMYYSHMY